MFKGMFKLKITCFSFIKADFSCDFENGICKNWYQDKQSDQLDWSLGKGSTGSSGTGPSTDHTKKTRKFVFYFLNRMGAKSFLFLSS